MEKSFPNIYSADEKVVIRQALTSTLTPVKNDKKRGRTRGEHIELRFQFDTLDTIDHWFEPLGENFQLSGYEVAELVDNVICDTWGVSGDMREQNHVTSDEYELIRHYKHDIPVIEDLRTYYEYNGMQQR